jgi:hypothetical protein
VRAAVIASLLLLSASSCHSSARELWTGPRILVQPGSPVVVVWSVKYRNVAVHSPPGELFAKPVDSVQEIALEATYQTLDVRTCQLGPAYRYPKSLEVFGWGTRPGELWIRRPDADGLEPLDGGARIPLGRAPANVWSELPFVSVGMTKGQGFLRIVDLSRRAMHEMPLASDISVDTILPIRLGDQNLVGLGSGKDRGSLDVVVVPLEDGTWRAPVTTRFEERPSGVQLLHGGTWLALPPNDWPGRSPPPKEPLALLIADVRSGDVVRRVEHQRMNQWALVETNRLWFAHAGGGSCRRLEVVDLEADTRRELPLPGCLIGLERWRTGAPFLTIRMDYEGPYTQLVDLRSGRLTPVPRGTPDWSVLVGDAYFEIDDRRAVSGLDLVTGERWQAVASAGRIASISAVPAARRMVLVNEQGSVLVYDVDARRVSKCM